jgi:hypothetical protein
VELNSTAVVAVPEVTVFQTPTVDTLCCNTVLTQLANSTVAEQTTPSTGTQSAADSNISDPQLSAVAYFAEKSKLELKDLLGKITYDPKPLELPWDKAKEIVDSMGKWHIHKEPSLAEELQ